MTLTTGFNLQPLRRPNSYVTIASTDDGEYSQDNIENTPVSDCDIEEWPQSGIMESRAALLDGEDTPITHQYISLPDFWTRTSQTLSTRQYWTRTSEKLGSRLPTGWRFGACVATFQAIIVLLLNIVILIWSGIRTQWRSSGPVLQGDCDTVSAISIGIHLVINVLSTLLLGASNYIMQSLCAPTRSEVDKAHARGSWLDIGVPSLRNLKHQSRSRKLLWLALCTSSIPLHLFYNSAFLSTLSTNLYTVYLVLGPEPSQHIPTTPKWCSGSEVFNDVNFAECIDVNLAGLTDGDLPLDFSNWDILDPFHCLGAYATDFISDRNDVLVVIGSNYTPSGTYIPLNSLSQQGYMTSQLGSTSFDWICSDPMQEDKWNCGPSSKSYCSDPQFCSSAWKEINPSKWNITWAADLPISPHWLDSTLVDYCISQPVESRCQLESNLPLLGIVIAFNIVKVVCMVVTVRKIDDKPLVTIGDAIASFTDTPDPHTIGMCLVLPRQLTISDNPGPVSLRYQPTSIRWFNTATRQHWILTISLFISALSIVLGLLMYAIVNLKSNGTQGLAALWQLGIGKPHAQTIIRNWAIPAQGYGALVASVLVANSPQLILSIIYIVFNSLCTTLFSALEWSSYARFRKPLRVSYPTGEQRSTYFLQIPYRFALPLMVYSTALHWLVSQSIFLVKINYQEILNTGLVAEEFGVSLGSQTIGQTIGNNTYIDLETLPADAENLSTSCGYSPLGMILSAAVAATLILSTAVFAFFRHLDGKMPIAGSRSTAISAACHPPEDGADSSKPLKWGVVLNQKYDPDRKAGVGHITFSSDEVLPPIPGYYYS